MVDASPVALEMKAKLEQTEPSPTSVRDTLNRAREQLPQNLPGVVFLRLPEKWAASESGRAAVEEGIRAAFDRTRRISAVIAHWERWQALNTGAARVVMFKHFVNSRARRALDSLERAVKAWPQIIGGGWIAFERLVCDEPDVAKAIAVGMALSVTAFARGAVAEPPPGFGTLCYGSLETLATSPSTIILTIFDFRSNEFDLFGAHPGRSTSVTLAAGPARTFTILRGEQTDAFQVQIAHPLNAALAGVVTEAAARLETIYNRAEAFQGIIEAVNDVLKDDPLIRLLGSLFDELRVEGDLKSSPCVLNDLVVSFLVSGTDEVVFRVRYLGIRFAI
jgi:hypothetical protein